MRHPREYPRRGRFARPSRTMHAARHAHGTAPAAGLVTTLLYDAAARDAGHPAIVCGATTLSYGALTEQAEQLARGLAALGVGPGDRVALVQGNTPEFVLTFLAASALGAVTLPLNPLYQRDELAYYFEHCEVRAIVTDAQHVPT